MKKVVGAVVGLLALSAVSSVVYAEDAPRVAVLRFTNNSNASWWRSGTGGELSDMLTNELAGTKKFKVLERREVDKVVSELKFGESGLVDPSTKSQLGRIKGAQYLITATVSSFEEDSAKKGGGVSFMGFSIGGGKAKAYIAVDLKVVDVETSEVVDTRTIEANSDSTSLNLSGSFMGIGGHTENKDKTPAGKAIRACVINIADYLTCSMVEKSKACTDKYAAKDEKRREKTKSSIELDD